MRGTGFWVPIVVSIGLTPIAIFLGLASAGAGHGNYFLAKVLFPFTMLSTALFGEINLLCFIFALIQYPLYGCLLAFGILMKREHLTFKILGALHLLAVLICFSVASPNVS